MIVFLRKNNHFLCPNPIVSFYLYGKFLKLKDKQALITPTLKGFILLIAAAFLWAVHGPLAKYLFNNGILPSDLVQARITYSFFALLLVFTITNRQLFIIEFRDLAYFALLGIGGFALAQFTYFYAISKIDVGVAVALQYTAPTLIVLYNYFILKESISTRIVLAIGLALLGCYLVIGAYHTDIKDLNWVGILVGVASAFTFAFYTVYSKKGLAKYNTWTVFFYVLLFASLFWNLIHPPLVLIGQGHNYTTWLMVLSVAIFGTLLPFTFFLIGVKLLDPVRATVTATLEPIFATIIAFLFLGEQLHFWQLLGDFFIVGSILLMSLKKKKEEKE